MSDHAAERLGRLAAKSQSLEGLPPGYGGITSSDIAASLAGSSDIGCHAALYAYAQHAERRTPAERALWLRVTELAAKHRWQSDVGILWRLTRIAIAEHAAPRLCWRCGGRGTVHRQTGVVETCDRCLGTGDGQYSERQYADACGICRARWRREWAARYRDIAAIVAAELRATLGRSAWKLKA